MELPVYVVDMKDNCLLGNFEGTFAKFFGIFSQKKEEDSFCSRIMREANRVPQFLKELFEKETQDLNEKQKKRFANFLTEFRDVISEEIIAGNCKVVKHIIKIEDSNPIKQAPRRIPFHLQKEVDKIIEEMRQQEVIEESYSP